MTEPAKKLRATSAVLSRTKRLLSERQANKPAVKQAQSPGKFGQTGKQKSGAPEHVVTQNHIDGQKKIGRPSSYTEEMGLLICEHVTQGKAFTWEKLREEGLPSPSTIFRWLEENELFRQRYARAREIQATIYADEILTIADTCEDPNKARLQVDARKWHASKTAPKVWGDLQRVEVNTTINVATAHADALMRLASQAKQIETDYKDITPR